jgi:hypothetical protein
MALSLRDCPATSNAGDTSHPLAEVRLRARRNRGDAVGAERIRRADLGQLAVFGIIGLAGVQALYFAAITRLDIGVALTIQYLGTRSTRPATSPSRPTS